MGSSPIGHPISLRRSAPSPRRPAPPRKWIRPDLARAAGAATALRANAEAALAQVEANVPGVVRGRNPEHLHQLRVGIRRLRSALRAFRPLLRRDATQGYDDRLREALHALGTVRDWDVLQADWPGLRLLSHVRRERARARGGARRLLDSAGFRGLPGELRAWLARGAWRPGAVRGEPMARFGARSLGRLHRRLLESARGIDWADGALRHRVRIRLKRLRYGCDCFAAAWDGKAARRFHRRLHRLQNVLGTLNDVQVQGRLLGELEAAGGRAAAIGRARRVLREKERKGVARLPAAWAAFAAVRPYWRR